MTLEPHSQLVLNDGPKIMVIEPPVEVEAEIERIGQGSSHELALEDGREEIRVDIREIVHVNSVPRTNHLPANVRIYSIYRPTPPPATTDEDGP